MDETIVNRLLLLMEAYGFSAGAFADKIEVQRSSISHLMSGRNKPSLDFIQKVLLQFPDINPSWLIMGKGPMKQLNLFDEVGKVAEPAPLPPAVANKFESTPEPTEANTAINTKEKKETSQASEPSSPVDTPIETIEQTPVAVVKPEPAPLATTTPTNTEPNPTSLAGAPIFEPIATTSKPNPSTATRKAVKIVFFYDDNTFETFYPGN
ncbi:MAG: helix-turn-helix transcriptional regulator [Cytophagaceae bacterium]